MSNNEELEKDVELDISTIEDESVQKHIQTLGAQKKHFKEKFQTVFNEFEEYKKTHPEKENVNKEKVEDQTPNNAGVDEVKKQLANVELKVEGYSDDEIEFLNKVGGKEALSNEFVKTAIEKMREKKKSQEADPQGNGSQTFKNFSYESLKGKSSAELEKMIKEGKVK